MNFYKHSKYALLIFCMSFLIAPQSSAIDMTDWYQYNGNTKTHSFSIRFPTDWQVKTYSDDEQGLMPAEENETAIASAMVKIHEFEGQTYEQAINYYTNENIQLKGTEDKIFTMGNDIIGKIARYKDINGEKEFEVTFIKRGNVVISLISDTISEKYSEIVQLIHDSFRFTDNWHQYIDYKEGYTFIFPSSLNIQNLGNGVEIAANNYFADRIFLVEKYEGIGLGKVAEKGKRENEKIESTEEIVFHGIESAIRVVYHDNEADKNLSRVFVEKNGNSYGMTDRNIEANFPNLNTYDQYVIEILEAFEFFDIEGENYSYLYFSDVRENHVNATAIDYLAKEGIIDGYADGTFQPDGSINRAELTKLIVMTKANPQLTKYNSCFEDVEEDWYAPFVCYAKEKEWVDGYSDGTFRPSDPVNRVEAMKIILEVLVEEKIQDSEGINHMSQYSDIDLGAWYSKYFIFAETNDLLDVQHVEEGASGDLYAPDQSMSRKEVAEMIYRGLQME